MMKDLTVSIISITLGLFIIMLCRDLPMFIARGYPGPSFFPLLLSSVSILCGLILLIKFFKDVRKGGISSNLRFNFRVLRQVLNNKPVINALKFSALLVAYILLIPYAGFFLVSLIFMFITQVVYGVSTLKAFAISSAVILFVYVLFIGILKVVVPEPILGQLLYR